MNSNELLALAIDARKMARADVTGYKVGAALLTADGKVFTGCNIEDPSGIGITNICAERCAIIKALSDGYDKFISIAVAGGRETLEFCAPCGACRQYMLSWCRDIIVVLTDGKSSPKEIPLSELIPYSFTLPGG